MSAQIFSRARFCCTRFLTAAFLAARSGAFWLINNAIFGSGYDWGFLGDGFFLMFYHFIINAYFLVFCSYMLFRAFLRAGSNLSG